MFQGTFGIVELKIWTRLFLEKLQRIEFSFSYQNLSLIRILSKEI